LLDINNKEILQINSAFIAGALVFLTLSSIASTQEERWYRISAIVFGLGIIIAFSVSSLRAIEGDKDLALFIMKFGFLEQKIRVIFRG
jgi:predicted membrane channel-forming protein YqfA (hemolysin III family)